VSPESDELDRLDGPAYSTVARAVPFNLRSKVLGDNYLAKLSGFGLKIEKQSARPHTAKVTKGKNESKKIDPKVVKMGESSACGGNPYVFDPDSIPAVSVAETPLVVGAFSVHPRVGIVGVGQTVGVDVTFDPTGCDSVRESLRFVISGTDEGDLHHQTAAAFDITGDSCFPSIMTEDIPGIFEELEVVPSLSLPSGGVDGEDCKYTKLPVGKVVFAERERLMAWGPVMCGASGSKGVVERIRITNPTKIDIKVKFKILTVEEATELAAGSGVKPGGKDKTPKKELKVPKGGAVCAPSDCVFSVQPEVWDIPPHEHRYVSVYFKPSEIKSYRAVFAAEVEDSVAISALTARRRPVPGSGTSLSFDLGGSGTMPCITVEEPTQRLPDGSLLIDFNRVHLDRTSSRTISLRNHGVVPATCLFDVTGPEGFLFDHRDAALTIEPGQKEDLTVSFAPKALAGPNEAQLANVKVSVVNNQYDQYLVKMKAVAYECDAMIDIDKADRDTDTDSTNASQDEFTFSQINLAESPGNVCSSAYTFVLRSRSTHTLKFEFSVPDGTYVRYHFVASTLSMLQSPVSPKVLGAGTFLFIRCRVR
jgi:hypothetical protein